MGLRKLSSVHTEMKFHMQKFAQAQQEMATDPVRKAGTKTWCLNSSVTQRLRVLMFVGFRARVMVAGQSMLSAQPTVMRTANVWEQQGRAQELAEGGGCGKSQTYMYLNVKYMYLHV